MIYLSILMVLALFAVLHDVLNVREGRTASYCGAYVLLVCLAGFRFKVGGDTYNYMYTHELLPNLFNLFSTEVGIAKLQPLWLLFSAIAKSIEEDFYALQFLHAITVNTVIFIFIHKNTRFRHTGVFFYYFSLYPFFNFEVLRESLAICCFLVAIPYYTDRKWIRYYVSVIAAFLFHLSAVFLFLLPLIRNLSPRPLSLILLFAASTLLNPVMQAILSSSFTTNMIGFAISDYVEYNYTIFGLISIFFLYLTTPLALRWATLEKLRIKLNYGAAANSGLIIASLIPLFFIFYRLFNYFSILYILMACEVAHSIIRIRRIHKIRAITAPVIFSLITIFYAGRYFSDTSDLVPSTRWHIRWHPYHSIFDPVEVSDRERMLEIQNMGQR